MVPRFLLPMVVLGGCGFQRGDLGQSPRDGAPDVANSTPDAPRDAARDAPRDAATDAAPDAPRIPLDCLDAFQHGVTTSGPIQIAPAGTPYTAYCDMTTAGGGWTLVYVYGFTDYANMANPDNAVTPRPTWPLSSTAGAVPTSTTIPTSPTTSGALDYAQWAALGPSFLVTSNIDQWYACSAGTTSIVDPSRNGTVTCTVAKVLTATCTTDVPTGINWYTTGPWLQGGAQVTYPIFVFWDGSTTVNSWPTHDPCGQDGTNQLTGVTTPQGAIYLRRN